MTRDDMMRLARKAGFTDAELEAYNADLSAYAIMVIDEVQKDCCPMCGCRDSSIHIGKGQNGMEITHRSCQYCEEVWEAP
jgi:formate dehydrogenase maturation protein FdhE